MFSILTPTHNRANVIDRVYHSLRQQTYKDFEWIIIDDASTDHTSELIHQWQKEQKEFKITYQLLSTNMGKAHAVNYGLDICSHPITIIADDDDTFVSSTLEDLKAIWDSINKMQNGAKIGAVWTLVQDEEGNIIGEKFPADFWQVSFKQRVLARNGPPVGEKWHSWRTSVLQEFKKYTNPNSRIAPAVSWNRINQKYDFLCVNLVHRTYYLSQDGYILQKKSRLKVEKRHYYSSYYTLYRVSPYNILKEAYYRRAAFSYIKALYYYRDKEISLKGLRLFACALAFCLHLPKRLLLHLHR